MESAFCTLDNITVDTNYDRWGPPAWGRASARRQAGAVPGPPLVLVFFFCFFFIFFFHFFHFFLLLLLLLSLLPMYSFSFVFPCAPQPPNLRPPQGCLEPGSHRGPQRAPRHRPQPGTQRAGAELEGEGKRRGRGPRRGGEGRKVRGWRGAGGRERFAGVAAHLDRSAWPADSLCLEIPRKLPTSAPRPLCRPLRWAPGCGTTSPSWATPPTASTRTAARR